MKASRYNGTPESAAHLLDAGWDEHRRYAAQGAEQSVAQDVKRLVDSQQQLMEHLMRK